MGRTTRDAARRTGPGFGLRMVVALAVTLGTVGLVQYTLIASTLTDRALAQLTAAHTVDARVLRQLHAAGGLEPAQELLHHMASRPAVERVVLLDHEAAVVAAGTAGHSPHGADADEHGDGSGGEAAMPMPTSAPAHAASLGTTDDGAMVGERLAGAVDAVERVQATGRAETVLDDDSGRLVVSVPVDLEGSPHVLEVVRSGDDLRADVAALRWAQLRTLALGLLVGIPMFYVFGGRSLSARHDRAIEESQTDGLTGLSNHRTFHEDLRRAVEHSRRNGEPMTLALVDLDGFKQVNDTLGHRQGDKVLSTVALLLRDGRPDDRCYRIGGDEFAIILPQTSAAEALMPIERLRRTVEARRAGVTTSIGVASLSAECPDAETLIEHADAALYRAKADGRNRAVTAFGDVGTLVEHAPVG